MGDRDFSREYDELVKSLDVEIMATAELHKDRLRCAPGCCTCCTISSVLPLEAASLRQAVRILADDVKMKLLAHAEAPSCPLLVDGLCVVYRSRPVICRTHGLPIGYVDYERHVIDVSVCPVNFPDDYDFEQQELFFIDSVNAVLARLNEEFCASCGMNPLTRIAMQSLLNNLPEQEK